MFERARIAHQRLLAAEQRANWWIFLRPATRLLYEILGLCPYRDQSVCDTDISVKPKWFEISKLQHYDREWRLDAFRGCGKESIVPNTYHQTALMQRCEDVTALTTSAGDGEVSSAARMKSNGENGFSYRTVCLRVQLTVK